MACYLCALRENRVGFSLSTCAVTENTLPMGIHAMVLEILVFVGERFLLAWHLFYVPCARIAMAFRYMRAHITENTLPVSLQAMVLEILVFVGERFLLAWHVFCVPCARIAMASR